MRRNSREPALWAGFTRGFRAIVLPTTLEAVPKLLGSEAGGRGGGASALLAMSRVRVPFWGGGGGSGLAERPAGAFSRRQGRLRRQDATIEEPAVVELS